jgi:hypothetical protein
MAPRPDDIIVSNRAATVEHDVSVVPQGPHLLSAGRDVALVKAHELAALRRVDLWMTEDRTHFMLIASYREGTGKEDCRSPTASGS